MRYFPFCPAAIIRTLIFIGCVPALLLADNITGSVHDSSGAVIRGATVEISGPNLLKPLQLKTDPLGNFTSLEMLPGTYTIRILQEGFEPLVRTVELHGNAQLQLSLAIARKEVTVSVSGKVSALANSDPVYRQLRDLGVGETYRIDNLSFVNDVGAFRLANGTLTLLAPVNGITTGAVFLGDGHFSLRPVLGIDARDLKRRSGNEVLEEDFTAAVFRFSANEVGLFSSGLTTRAETPIDAASLLNHWRDHVRDRHEIPETFAQALLEGETMDNVDADLLGAIYNPKHPPFFNAYIHGKKHKDLRFFVRQRVGAIPQIDSPEEVALINFDPLSLEDGIWYLSHLKSEFQGRTANSAEERRLFATHAYKIETVIGKNHHLFSTAQISFASLVPGERVMKFGLLPNLRVAQVTDGSGQELYFIQESRKQDGSFYVILPQALPVGQEQKIHIEYSGDKVLETAGEGSFYVRARTAWYPNLNGFGEKALFDLTFKVPRKYKVISVGAPQGESVEQDLAVTHWVTPVPVAVAGFNYGDYKRLELADEKTGYKIFGYYLEQLPDNLRGYDALRSLAPHAMTEYAVSQTRTQLQICTYYSARAPTTRSRLRSSQISTLGSHGRISFICRSPHTPTLPNAGSSSAESAISSPGSCKK